MDELEISLYEDPTDSIKVFTEVESIAGNVPPDESQTPSNLTIDEVENVILMVSQKERETELVGKSETNQIKSSVITDNTNVKIVGIVEHTEMTEGTIEDDDISNIEFDHLIPLAPPQQWTAAIKHRPISSGRLYSSGDTYDKGDTVGSAPVDGEWGISQRTSENTICSMEHSPIARPIGIVSETPISEVMNTVLEIVPIPHASDCLVLDGAENTSTDVSLNTLIDRVPVQHGEIELETDGVSMTHAYNGVDMNSIISVHLEHDSNGVVLDHVQKGVSIEHTDNEVDLNTVLRVTTEQEASGTERNNVNNALEKVFMEHEAIEPSFNNSFEKVTMEPMATETTTTSKLTVMHNVSIDHATTVLDDPSKLNPSTQQTSKVPMDQVDLVSLYLTCSNNQPHGPSHINPEDTISKRLQKTQITETGEHPQRISEEDILSLVAESICAQNDFETSMFLPKTEDMDLLQCLAHGESYLEDVTETLPADKEVTKPVSHVVREGLRSKIQTTRLSEGKGELEVSFENRPIGEPSEEERLKIRRRKEMNKKSANQSRVNRQHYIKQLQSYIDRIEEENKKLRIEIELLDTDVHMMGNQLRGVIS